MKLLNSKVEQFYIGFIKANYERITAEPGACRFNYRCQMNAAHEAYEKKHKRFAMAWCIDEGHPFIHFLNFDGKKYTDNTLGHWAKFNKYHLIRMIGQEEFWLVDEIFYKYQKHLRRQLPWWMRLFSDYEG